jgi:hypothetical protein
LVDSILASNYLPIVRGNGQPDRNREETLTKTVGGTPGFLRHVGRSEIQVDLFAGNEVAIVRALLPATDSRKNPTVEASYRNMLVFAQFEDEWQCVAWQVTKVL